MRALLSANDPKRTLQLSTKAAYPILWLGTDQGHL
jgi:hypothetical protein